MTSTAFADLLPWLVVGAIGLFAIGLVVRMIVASRFPKGYKQWAASRRDAHAERSQAWDRDDDEFKH